MKKGANLNRTTCVSCGAVVLHVNGPEVGGNDNQLEEVTYWGYNNINPDSIH